MKIDLMGLAVNTDTKHEILAQLKSRLQAGLQTFIVTPYSEFYWYAGQNYPFRQIVNNADIALPDGISLLWLASYLNTPLTLNNYYAKILEAFGQEIVWLFKILLAPASIRKVIPEKISGSDFFWDLIQMASDNNLKIYFLGGMGDTPQRVAVKVHERFPSVNIVGSSNAGPTDPGLIGEINMRTPDILFVAYGPVKQETWIAQNLPRLNTKIAIGVGGTFDYVAGAHFAPPQLIRNIGLEWLYRLVTQPKRVVRIWHATFDFLKGALRNKVFMSLPYRENVVGVIINKEKKIFMGLRSPQMILEKRSADRWEFPQGGLNSPAENRADALLREMREETCMQSLEILGRAKKEHSFIWPHYVRPLLFNRKDRRFRGQHQVVYYLRFVGEDSEIKLERTELINYKWVKPEEIRAVSIPMKYQLVDIALAELDEYLKKN